MKAIKFIAATIMGAIGFVLFVGAWLAVLTLEAKVLGL